MTLPLTTILPIHSERIMEGGESLDHYMRELVFTLQRQYEDVAQAVNGDTRRSVDSGSVKWEPVLRETGNAVTFAYDPNSGGHQVGSVLRQGLMVDVCFDIQWTGVASGATGAGNMYIDLPYKVAVAGEKPFVGSVQPSGFTFTSGAGTSCVLNAIENTYRLEIWNTGNAISTANQGSVSTGQLSGHIRYAGQAIERD